MLAQLREVTHYREAVRNMVSRDLKVRYSHSVLGVVWGLFNPLLMTLVYTVVFTYLMPTGIARFPVFILAALLPWNFFSSTVATTTSAITSNGQLINRVYFPREILPVSNLLSNAVNFLIALGLLFVFVLVYRVPLTLAVLWLPALIGIEVALVLGLGLLLSAVNVFFRDTQQIVEIGLLAWFFLTPIIYPLEMITKPGLRLALQALNPMASLVVAYRDILYIGQMPNLGVLAITAGESALLLAVGALVFRRLSPTFAEAI